MKVRYLLVLPLAAALMIEVVVAHTPGTHTGLFVAMSLCLLVVVVGVATVWTQSYSQRAGGNLDGPPRPAERRSGQEP